MIFDFTHWNIDAPTVSVVRANWISTGETDSIRGEKRWRISQLRLEGSIWVVNHLEPRVLWLLVWLMPNVDVLRINDRRLERAGNPPRRLVLIKIDGMSLRWSSVRKEYNIYTLIEWLLRDEHYFKSKNVAKLEDLLYWTMRNFYNK